MLIYWLLLAVGVLAGIPMCRNKIGKAVYCSLVGIALFLIAALRRYVGYDYNSYGTIYINAMSSSIDDIAVARTEKGFMSILKILCDYFIEYQTLFIVTSFVFALGVGYVMFRYCKKPYLGLFFFMTFGLYFNSLNFLRQIIAAFIVMYALKYVHKNQFFRFMIIVLLAACFHFSALLMIPFYFILRIKMNYWSLGAFAAFAVLFMIFSWNILDFITNYIYRSYDPYSSVEMAGGLTPLYAVYYGVCFIPAFILRDRLIKKNSFNNILLNCMFFTFFFELIGAKHAIISRFALLFMIPSALLLMPQVVMEIIEVFRVKFRKDKKKATILSAASVTALMAVCVGMFGYFTANGYNGVTPYHTVFYTEWGTENETQTG